MNGQLVQKLGDHLLIKNTWYHCFEETLQKIVPISTDPTHIVAATFCTICMQRCNLYGDGELKVFPGQ